MDALYQWAGSILCFLIFITMAVALLPSKKYEKYIRFFAGMVLILLIVRPLAGGLRLEDRVAYYFETITFQKESRDLSREILGIESQRLKRMIEEYEKAVEQEISIMAEEAGFFVEQVKVKIEDDQSQAAYGTVVRVVMVLTREDYGREADGTAQGEKANQEGIVIGSIEIEPIQAGQAEGRELGGEGLGREGAHGRGPAQDGPGGDLAYDENAAQLRRKVERYYGLEREEVEIQLKAR